MRKDDEMAHVKCKLHTTNLFTALFTRTTLRVSAVFAVLRCPPVTLVHCIHTSKDIVKLLVRPDAPSL